jgi:hypothetical protein
MEDTPRTTSFDTRTLAMGLAGIRLGIGGALVLAPQFAARLWVGPGAEGAGTRVLARALGARDVVLGYRTLQAARTGEATAGWLQLGAMADAADTVAALIAYRGIPGHRRFTMPLVAAAVGSACFWAARQGGGSSEDAAEEVAPGAAGQEGGDDVGSTADVIVDLDELIDAPEPSTVAAGDPDGLDDLDDLDDLDGSDLALDDVDDLEDREELDDDAAATILDVTADRLDVLVADGVIEPCATDPRRFRRSELLAVRLTGG